MQKAMACYHDAVFQNVFSDVLDQLEHTNNPFRHYTNAFIAVQLWIVVCRPYVDAMDEATSQIPVAIGRTPPPRATPADNHHVMRESLRNLMADLVSKTGVWAERKPHEDFTDKEHGLYGQVRWRSSVSPKGEKKRKEKGGETPRAKKSKADKLGTSNTAPCLLHLAAACKVKINKKPAVCNWKPKAPAVKGDCCPRGWHCDVASMTRKDCEEVAAASKWRYAQELLAGIKAADASIFHP